MTARFFVDTNVLLLPVADLVGRLNRMLRGRANYFRLGRVRPAYGLVDRYVCRWASSRRPSCV
jgi:hypothetical protein